MHFIDRNAFPNAPTEILAQLHAAEQSKWLNYKNWIETQVPPPYDKPTNKWNNDSIRNPLIELFKTNCAYCGIYSDKDHDGEVDHFLPNKKDLEANFIYSWNNLVWACHSCNNKKRSSYPLINPCDSLEVNEIYFHSSDGRYLIKASATQEIKDKFQLTEQMTFINGKKCPERRKFIAKHLNYSLSLIRTRALDYEIENNADPLSANTTHSLNKLNESINEFKEFLKSKDFIFLKMQLFESFKTSNPDFVYNYSDFN